MPNALTALVGHRTLAGSTARRLGAYYTPPMAAQFMADWCIRRGDERVLEPSVGDGVFVGAVGIAAARRDRDQADVTGVEIAIDTYMGILAQGLLAPDKAILSDFLAVRPFPVDVAIGNPPYVRLRHLPQADATRARTAAERVLGSPMEPAGSLWMPIVLHASEFLANGGRMAFVLPYDATYVRYARPFWGYLAREFESVRVVRVHERVFPDILQDVILLLAEGRGGSTTVVEFEALATPAQLGTGESLHRATVDVGRLIKGDRAFVEALLPDDLVALLREKVAPGTVEVRERVAFNIGYVSGDKRFFHPNAATVTKYRLPESSLVASVTSSRLARRNGIRTSGLPELSRSQLFLPPADEQKLSLGERRYVRWGVETGVSRRYKCRVRTPWYVTPDVRRPDLILPVFADRPILLINDARLTVSNSLLVGTLRSGSPEAFAASWYTTLTLLEVELRVHSLGGGVMIFIPGETGSIRVAKSAPDLAHLARVEALIRADRVEDAYAAGDHPVLSRGLGLTSDEARLLGEGVATLRYWRSSRPKGAGSVEDVPEDQALLECADHAVDEGVDGHVEVQD